MDRVRSVVLGSDEGAFAIRSSDCEPIPVEGWDESDNTLVRAGGALAADGELLVTTGDQWGPFSVTTCLLDVPPGAPGVEWEDVVELSLEARASLVATELVDNDPSVPLIDEPGVYRLRLSARGRATGHDRQDDELGEEPIEWYRLEAWRAAPSAPAILRLTSAFAHEQLADPPPPLLIPEGEAGLAASVRIGRDVEQAPGARSLSGATGYVEVERTIRGTRRKLFTRCAHVTTWSHAWVPGGTWGFSAGPEPPYAPGTQHFASSHDHADQLTGSCGSIRYSFIEVESPKRAVRNWNWLPGPTWDNDGAPMLREESRVTMTLNQSKDAAGVPWTTIRIRHEGLPVEWLEDMETWWAYQLSIADHAEFGTR
ncbi:hypothetical protein [Nocardioides sp. BYT-33-1]|uniref:hypothetical protein n=1 Tax=Nocardioides sp. BYT-33-1 TaxID=3416952 RepID=UPI003F539816